MPRFLWLAHRLLQGVDRSSVVQDEPIASAPISSSLVTPVAAPSQEESDAYQKAYELIKDKSLMRPLMHCTSLSAVILKGC